MCWRSNHELCRNTVKHGRSPVGSWLTWTVLCLIHSHTKSRVVWSRTRCLVSSEQPLVHKIAPLHRCERTLVPYLCFYTLHGLSVRSLGFLEVQSCQRLLVQLMFPFTKQYFKMIRLQSGVFLIPVNFSCHLLFYFIFILSTVRWGWICTCSKIKATMHLCQ